MRKYTLRGGVAVIADVLSTHLLQYVSNKLWKKSVKFLIGLKFISSHVHVSKNNFHGEIQINSDVTVKKFTQYTTSTNLSSFSSLLVPVDVSQRVFLVFFSVHFPAKKLFLVIVNVHYE